MKPAAHGLAAAALSAALAFAPGLALAQTTSTQNTTGMGTTGAGAGMGSTGMGSTGMGSTGTAATPGMGTAPGLGTAATPGMGTNHTTGMAAPSGQGTASGMVPGTRSGTAAASGNDNQAVVTTPANATTPAHGANSFTRGEVRRRLEARGFTQVSGLKKDTNGVWRGQATHEGAATPVWLDYKGNAGAGAAQ